MNHKELVYYLNENCISIDLSDVELREISKKEGLINYTMAYLPELKIIKVNKNETFTNVNELVMLKKNRLDNESPSIYLDRTFTTVTPSMLDDSSIEKYETERKKNVRIKCWKVYAKATGKDVRKKEFLIYCEKNGIEVPIKPYEKTVFGFMIKKFDKEENYFLIDRSNQKSEKLRLMKKETITSNKESLPNFVEAKDILWDIDGIIGCRKNGNKLKGFVHGRKTWEPFENIQPGNEQNGQTKISYNKNVHFEDYKRKNVVIDLF
ncbi:unnamed protein product [Brachionus calyciflorus]|uniref:Uncharacterized protein n=1 Tax=Brachionus calyciflorus TaxID=104777 RepID=A0A814JWA1_9BILA|nr:unnamed protein product [Brachionus calyciflorus]